MLAIGSDHGGFALKQEIMKHLTERGIEYHDYGTYSDESCDYPEYGEGHSPCRGQWRVRPRYRDLRHRYRYILGRK